MVFEHRWPVGGLYQVPRRLRPVGLRDTGLFDVEWKVGAEVIARRGGDAESPVAIASAQRKFSPFASLSVRMIFGKDGC